MARQRPGRAGFRFMNHSFCRVRQTLRLTPAMEAGVTDHISTIEEVIDLLDTQQLRVA